MNRLNKFIAQASGMSRRNADTAILEGRVMVNGKIPSIGQSVSEQDVVTLDNGVITPPVNTRLVMMNKPVGYICSRDGQGGRTVYELLPPDLAHLKTIGRLDKNSSGLLLFSNDGQLAHALTHPKFAKVKKYKVALNKSLSKPDLRVISRTGVTLDDGVSKLELEPMGSQAREWKVTMSEGRNRQIRRTFEALGYTVVKLHRTHFGGYQLGSLQSGAFQDIDQQI